MRINVNKLSIELRAILDNDGISVIELANRTGVAPETLYSILDGSRSSTQRATIRKIAEATGRNFVIDGDSVRFVIADKPQNDNLTQQEREFLEILRGLDDDGKNALIDLAGSIWRAEQLTKKRQKPSESSGD
jgi:predicted transcriptional regulator